MTTIHKLIIGAALALGIASFPTSNAQACGAYGDYEAPESTAATFAVWDAIHRAKASKVTQSVSVELRGARRAVATVRFKKSSRARPARLLLLKRDGAWKVVRRLAAR
jgi:hypothetical protein